MSSRSNSDAPPPAPPPGPGPLQGRTAKIPARRTKVSRGGKTLALPHGFHPNVKRILSSFSKRTRDNRATRAAEGPRVSSLCSRSPSTEPGPKRGARNPALKPPPAVAELSPPRRASAHHLQTRRADVPGEAPRQPHPRRARLSFRGRCVPGTRLEAGLPSSRAEAPASRAEHGYSRFQLFPRARTPSATAKKKTKR